MTKLKPCPFCGSESFIKDVVPNQKYIIYCSEFGCTASMIGWVGFGDRSERVFNALINKWNTRHE